jgi:outer membrane protein OmpA-like peptidoglycan-associated protein
MLTSKALGNLKKFVDRMPDGATNVAVTVLGYVQPSSTSGNDAKLSLSRAYATTKALKAAGISAARWNVKGKGKANETGAKARKVVVTFTYSIPAAG